MRLDPWALARMTCLSVVLGMALSVFWELMRFVWSLVGVGFGADGEPRGRWSVTAERIALFFRDVIFFAAAGCSFAVLVYGTNNGRVRLSAVLGVPIGMWLGYLTVGKLLRCVCGALSRVLREAVAAVATAIVGAVRTLVGRVSTLHAKCKKIKGKKGSGNDAGTKGTKDQ